MRGKACRWWANRPSGRVQPRVCGESILGQHEPNGRVGSTPRMRGKGHARGNGLAQARFNPACAGKRGAQEVGAHRRRVQPRVRGEKSKCAVMRGIALGSTPRARGKAVSSRSCSSVSGFNPAYAGKSVLRGTSPMAPWVQPRVRGEITSLPAGLWTLYRVFSQLTL